MVAPNSDAVPGSTKPPRLDSVDLLRGMVMVIMALDHVRDFFTELRFEPTDLSQASAALFLTRWITHFCAPVFVFLAGTGAFLSASRGRSTKELSWFLLTRGVWIVILEFTLVRFGWLLNFDTTFLFGQVIWAIGWSLIVLSALVHLPVRVIGLIGIIIVALHNLLDDIKPEAFGSLAWLWKILHVSDMIDLGGGRLFWPVYPLLPWIGVMAAGYAFGTILQYEPDRRRKVLLRLGLGMTVVFVLIRFTNLYGDPAPWSTQTSGMFTILSFLNTTKYPPSLLFLLMTLGPSIAALSWFDRGIGKLARPLIVFGRVPMFYYILHLYIIHFLAILAGVIQGYTAGQMLNGFWAFPEQYGYNLFVVYMMWIVTVVLLYPACKWFAGVKRRSKNPLWSYL